MGKIYDEIMLKASEIYKNMLKFESDIEIDVDIEITKLNNIAKELQDKEINKIEEEYNKKRKELKSSFNSRVEEARKKILMESNNKLSLNDAIIIASSDYDEIEKVENKKIIDILHG